MVENVTEIKRITNVDASVKIKKTLHEQKKLYLEPCTCSCEDGKYLESIIDDSVITCDEIIEETKIIPTNFSEKR